ncbi:hypothetical protein MC885_008143 [Smutsia gigantea]|nr:hypothetical protein MC885_008143 [Smutsia gigantea]
MEDGLLPDLRDIELKLGRKVPESLVRSLRGEEPAPQERDRDPCGGSGGGCSTDDSSCSFPASLSSSSASSPTSGSPRRSHRSALERLDTKLHLLRQEMCRLGTPDSDRLAANPQPPGRRPAERLRLLDTPGACLCAVHTFGSKGGSSFALTAKILPRLRRGGWAESLRSSFLAHSSSTTTLLTPSMQLPLFQGHC